MRTATRLALGALVLAVLVVWGLLALTWRDSRSDPAPGEANPSGKVSGPSGASGGAGRGLLRALPAVAQPGNLPAKATAARTLLVARFDPAQKGAVVLLERQDRDGWHVVASTQQDRSGTATFTDVRLSRSARTARYQATALRPDGSRAASTNGIRLNRWSLKFDDQFEGAAIDSAKWNYRQLGTYNPEGSRQCSKSDTRAVVVSGGTLQLQVQEDPERQGEVCATPKYGTFAYYLNGHVSTDQRFDFTHGVAAARVKFQEGRGQHGAFWMQPTAGHTPVPGDPGKSGAEVDVVEYFGEGYPGGGLASFLFYLNAQNASEKVGGVWPKATKQLPPGDAWWRSYHVFSVEWTPKQYVFRVDGRETFRTRKGVSGIPQYLILSLLTSDWELPKLHKSTLPSTMKVDWVRVWQKNSAKR